MPELLALLELGSNATRCLLARIDPGIDFHILDHERVQTRLGDGAPGTLPPEASTGRSRRAGSSTACGTATGPRVVAVATAAVRDAANRDRLLGPLRRHAGVDVAGPERARGGAPGRAGRAAPCPSRTAWSPTWAASLQLTRVRRGTIVSTASLPLGAVRHHAALPPTRPAGPGGAARACGRQVRDALAAPLPAARPGETLVGLGGTVRALARLHLAAARAGPRHAARAAPPPVGGHGRARAAGGLAAPRPGAAGRASSRSGRTSSWPGRWSSRS